MKFDSQYYQYKLDDSEQRTQSNDTLWGIKDYLDNTVIQRCVTNRQTYRGMHNNENKKTFASGDGHEDTNYPPLFPIVQMSHGKLHQNKHRHAKPIFVPQTVEKKGEIDSRVTMSCVVGMWNLYVCGRGGPMGAGLEIPRGWVGSV